MSGAIRQIAGETVYVCAPEGPKLEGDRWPSEFIGDLYVAGAKVSRFRSSGWGRAS